MLQKLVFRETHVSRALIAFQRFHIKSAVLFSISVCASNPFERLINQLIDFSSLQSSVHLSATFHQTSKKRRQISNNRNKTKVFTNLMTMSSNIITIWKKKNHTAHFFEFCFPTVNYFQILTKRNKVKWNGGRVCHCFFLIKGVTLILCRKDIKIWEDAKLSV